MGHYQLTYGRYGSQIHARPSGNTALGPHLEDEVLWLTIVAVAHRLSALSEHRHGDARRLAARIVTDLSDEFRFTGPPAVGEQVRLFGDGETAYITEFANDATVALVRRESDGTLEVRRSIELLSMRS
jgi:hypothetical protein